jgi:hypothetical protein
MVTGELFHLASVGDCEASGVGLSVAIIAYELERSGWQA